MSAPARLVTACTWLIVTVAGASVGCQLDPGHISTVGAEPDAAAPRQPDAATQMGPAPEGDPPVHPDAGTQTPPPDVRPPDGRGSSPGGNPFPDAREPDRAPPVQPPPDAAPDTGGVGPDVPPVDPGAGLVARWTFDEGSGTTAGDITGNGNTGTLHNGVAWEKSAVARSTSDFAVRLDGRDDFLSMVVGNTLPRIQDAKSIAYWFAADENPPPNPGSNQRTCVALVNGTAAAGVQLGTDRNRWAVWSWGQNQGFVTTNNTPAAGAHHLAYTFDGRTHRLYLDGVMVDSATPAPQQGRASDLFVGSYDPPAELCAGQIDDLRIYSRAITAAEVTLIAARPDPGQVTGPQ
jgi:hypothetical protein